MDAHAIARFACDDASQMPDAFRCDGSVTFFSSVPAAIFPLPQKIPPPEAFFGAVICARFACEIAPARRERRAVH